jgi:hypothetical protein
MIIPPFGCLTYSCSPSEAANVTLLTGIWIALVGCVAVALGGFIHAFSPTARDTQALPWVAESQGGMTPWLGVAALGAVAQFIFGYTFFTFYTVSGFFGGETQTWGGWLATPHTSSLILAITVVIVGVVVAAGRERSPLNPAALGGLVAVLGFIAAARILYRIIDPPFSTAGDGSAQVGSVDISVAAYLSLASAVVVVITGIVHAATNREESVQKGATEEEEASGRA